VTGACVVAASLLAGISAAGAFGLQAAMTISDRAREIMIEICFVFIAIAPKT
jgi:ABC-type uncharacterized transport system permease subunit